MERLLLQKQPPLEGKIIGWWGVFETEYVFGFAGMLLDLI
jgi:hypothetical protein